MRSRSAIPSQTSRGAPTSVRWRRCAVMIASLGLSFLCAISPLTAQETESGPASGSGAAPEAGPAQETEVATVSAPPGREHHFSLRFALESRYDDNIIQLSECGKELLRNDRAVCGGRVLTNRPGSDRFRITTADDYVGIGRFD